MPARRLVIIGMGTAALMATSVGTASAHLLSVETPSGHAHTQVLHSGDATLPPHSGALELHVTCNLNGTNPAVTVLGPSSCFE